MDIKGETVKLILQNDRMYLTPDHFLTFSQLNLGSLFEKPFSSPAYIIAKILNYKFEEKLIFVDPVQYVSGNTQFDKNQESFYQILNQIKTIRFFNISTDGIFNIRNTENRPSTSKIQQEPTSNHKRQVNTPLNKPHSKITKTSSDILQNKPLITPLNQPSGSPSDKTLSQIIDKTFTVPIQELVFENGYVHHAIEIKNIDSNLDLKIENPHIRKEFGVVKKFLERILNTKYVHIIVNLVYKNGCVLSQSAVSPQIEMIDSNLITNARQSFVKDCLKEIKKGPVNTISTIDDFFKLAAGENINKTSSVRLI